MNNDKDLALDVHQATIVADLHDADDRCLQRSIFEIKAAAVRDFIRGLSGTLHVVFEEGTQAAWLYDLIRPLAAEVVVCDPRHNQLIASGNKSDNLDAHKLAHLLRLGAVKSVYQGEAGLRTLKELVHCDDAVVSDLTRAKNRPEGALPRPRDRLPRADGLSTGATRGVAQPAARGRESPSRAPGEELTRCRLAARPSRETSEVAVISGQRPDE